MNLDEKYICVFIRQNMFPDHQMVHSFHLGFLIGRAVDGFCQKRHTLEGHPIALEFGEPDEAALLARSAELSKLGVEHITWRDPDSSPEHDDYGLIGLVTEPLTKSQRNKLPRWRQWSQSKNVHPFSSTVAPDAQQEGVVTVSAGGIPRTMCTAEALGQFPHNKTKEKS